MGEEVPRRRRRRAVGPPGAPVGEPVELELEEPQRPEPPDDDERLRREVPPHHGG